MNGSERTNFGELVGRSAAMRGLFAEAAQLAPAETTILIHGEAGTGKDLLARTLHAHSARQNGPFLALDCGALAPGLLEQELFGRAQGEAGGRPGALERVQGGTILLDEVADLPRALQPRLCAALDTRRFARAGAGELLALDARVIAASKRKLAAEVERGKLEPALYALLRGAELSLPPLRERREDIPLLARHLVEHLGEEPGAALTHDALELLSLHDWPGNVRELRNVIERLLVARQGGGPAARLAGVLLTSDRVSGDGRPSPLPEASAFEPGLSYREERARFEAGFEQRYVAWLLDRHDGNVSAAARAAGMDRKYLYKLARKHALKPDD